MLDAIHSATGYAGRGSSTANSMRATSTLGSSPRTPGTSSPPTRSDSSSPRATTSRLRRACPATNTSPPGTRFSKCRPPVGPRAPGRRRCALNAQTAEAKAPEVPRETSAAGRRRQSGAQPPAAAAARAARVRREGRKIRVAPHPRNKTHPRRDVAQKPPPLYSLPMDARGRRLKA